MSMLHRDGSFRDPAAKEKPSEIRAQAREGNPEFYFDSKGKKCTVKNFRAKQEFKEECDINMILKKFQRTEAISHWHEFHGAYGDATANDFMAAMVIVTEAQQMFDALPSELRNRFNHSPAEFLDFVQDPANADKMHELGLTDVPIARRVQTLEEPPAAGGEVVQGDPPPSPPGDQVPDAGTPAP